MLYIVYIYTHTHMYELVLDQEDLTFKKKIDHWFCPSVRFQIS